jgi:sialate O-acetylesterase
MNAFLAGPARACRSLTVIAGLLVASRASAEIEITSPTLRDGAVLQRGQPIVVSGRARGGARVTATLAKETKSATATQAGRFRVVFDARPAGGPLTLSLMADRDTKTVRDLLVGDVWVCSGQSNMEFTLSRALDAEAEIQAAHAPQIRHFKIPRSWAVTPSDTLDGGSWAHATPDNVGDFTAVGYYFAKKVHAELGVPIGLVGTNWGGSAIEAWMSARALGKAPQQTAQVLQNLVQQAEADARIVKKKLRRWPGSLVDTVDKAEGDYSGAKQDTGEWATIEVPGLWEGKGFAGVAGSCGSARRFRSPRPRRAETSFWAWRASTTATPPG